MNKLGISGGKIVLWLITGSLLLFTAYRSIHLVASTMPVDAQILAFSALAALDGGMVGWLYFYTSEAVGGQRVVAGLLVFADFAGLCAALLADTFLISGGNPEFVKSVAVWIVPIIICANVLGVLMIHLVGSGGVSNSVQSVAPSTKTSRPMATFADDSPEPVVATNGKHPKVKA